MAHQLELGKKYSVIVTTSGGLYRYRLNDVVEVVGHARQCPLIQFTGKLDKVVDLCGEKLNEEFVKHIISRSPWASALDARFCMVAPEDDEIGSPFYTLFVQASADSNTLMNIAATIESGLMENFHYEYCRRLGQLQALRVFAIDQAAKPDQIYLSVCMQAGQRLGDIKPSTLHPFRGWASRFPGRFLQAQSSSKLDG